MASKPKFWPRSRPRSFGLCFGLEVLASFNITALMTLVQKTRWAYTTMLPSLHRVKSIGINSLNKLIQIINWHDALSPPQMLTD